jgi:hypothetical protein
MAIDWAWAPDVFWSLAIWSLVFISTNRVYRFAEHTVIACGVGYAFVSLNKALITQGIEPILGGDYLTLIGFIFGALVLLKLYVPLDWISRIPMSFLIGTSAGLMTRGFLGAQVIRQVERTMINFGDINSVIILVLTISAVTYFIFTVRTDIPGLKQFTRLGRIAFMIMFGALYITYGNSRVEYLLNALKVVFWNFLGLQPL